MTSTARTIHFHHSDSRFCGSQAQCRQFTLIDADVTCPDCDAARRQFGLVCAQGTTCVETILKRHEYTAEWRQRIEAQFCTGHEDAPIPGTWRDVTELVDDLTRCGLFESEPAYV